MPYLGREGQFGVRDRFQYLASNGDTSVSGSDVNGVSMTFSDGLYIDVFLNGVKLKAGEDYNTTTANTVAGITAMNANDEVEVITYDAFTVADTVSAADGGTFSGNVAMSGTLGVTGNVTMSADASVGDDLTLGSDAAVINLGADQDVTITHVADTGITLNDMDIAGVASINGEQIGGRRNLLYNGEMRVAQRATSVTGIGNGDTGYHTLDRWRFNEGGTIQAEVTMSQDTDVPAGQGFSNSLKLDVTTAEGAVAADERFIIDQIIEQQDLTHLNWGTSSAKSLTLSFWIKSTKTGTYCVGFYNGSPSTDRILTKTYTVDSADTWEKKTLTWVGDTDSDSAFAASSASGLFVQWWFLAGSNYTDGTLTSAWVDWDDGVWGDAMVNAFDSTSNNVYLTGVQLEAGTTATEYEHHTFGDELAECERYCVVYSGAGRFGLGQAYSATLADVIVPYRRKMRAAPTLVISAATDFGVVNATGGGLTLTALSTTSATSRNITVRTTVSSGQVAGYAIQLVNVNADAKLTISAEL